MLKKIIIYMLPLLIACVVLPAQTVDRTKIPELSLDRPDIVLEKIKLTKLPTTKRGKIKLKIEAWLSNNSSKYTRCCPTETGKHMWKQSPSENMLFRVRVFAKYNSNVYYIVAGTSTEMGPNQQNQRYQFTREFDSGYKLNIKVAADPENWINEKNENNNIKKMYWPLRVKIVN